MVMPQKPEIAKVILTSIQLALHDGQAGCVMDATCLLASEAELKENQRATEWLAANYVEAAIEGLFATLSPKEHTSTRRLNKDNAKSQAKWCSKYMPDMMPNVPQQVERTLEQTCGDPQDTVKIRQCTSDAVAAPPTPIPMWQHCRRYGTIISLAGSTVGSIHSCQFVSRNAINAAETASPHYTTPFSQSASNRPQPREAPLCTVGSQYFTCAVSTSMDTFQLGNTGTCNTSGFVRKIRIAIKETGNLANCTCISANRVDATSASFTIFSLAQTPEATRGPPAMGCANKC